MSVPVTRSCRSLGVGRTEGFFYLLIICRSFAFQSSHNLAIFFGGNSAGEIKRLISLYF